MVSVKAAATGKVSWGPMVMGLGPLEHPAGQAQRSTLHKVFCILMSYEFCTEDGEHSTGGLSVHELVEQVVQLTFKS